MKNKKILYILSGNEPSGFVRARLYREAWIKKGDKVDYIQLKSEFLIKLMMKAKPVLLIKLLIESMLKLNSKLRQWYMMNVVKKYDVIIAIKYLKSPLLEQIRKKSKALLVYDFDDAVWLPSFSGEEEFGKRVSAADVVTCGNAYLAKHAAIYNKNSYVVNAPCQIEQFTEYQKYNPKPEPDNEIVIGWIGSDSTLFSLYKVYDALEIIGSRYPQVVLKLVGTDKDKKMVPRFEKIKTRTVGSYNQEEMVRQVSSFDIGLYPLFQSELAMGRGPLKATIYMAAKVPFVCSGYIENNKIVSDGVNGFLANDTQEWIEKLSLLIENSDLRKRIGENGYRYAIENCSVEKCADQLFTAIENHLSVQ